MISLLREYETICIQKEDYSLAEEAKMKIEQLKGQQVVARMENIAVKEKEQVSISSCRPNQFARWVRMTSRTFNNFGTYKSRPSYSSLRKLRKIYPRIRNDNETSLR